MSHIQRTMRHNTRKKIRLLVLNGKIINNPEKQKPIKINALFAELMSLGHSVASSTSALLISAAKRRKKVEPEIADYLLSLFTKKMFKASFKPDENHPTQSQREWVYDEDADHQLFITLISDGQDLMPEAAADWLEQQLVNKAALKHEFVRVGKSKQLRIFDIAEIKEKAKRYAAAKMRMMALSF